MGDIDPRFGGSDGFLPIFRQPPAAPKPGEGALDHPPSRQNLEALGGVGAFDDLQGPLAHPVERAAQFGSGELPPVSLDIALSERRSRWTSRGTPK